MIKNYINCSILLLQLSVAAGSLHAETKISSSKETSINLSKGKSEIDEKSNRFPEILNDVKLLLSDVIIADFHQDTLEVIYTLSRIYDLLMEADQIGEKNLEDEEEFNRFERSFMDKLGGGCNSPIAAFSSVNGDKICLIGAVLSLDGKVLIKDKAEANKNENVDLDNLLANKILENGGKELIKKFDFE